MARRRRDLDRPDPFAVLGLTADVSEREVVEARRRLAKRAHPDAGGSVEMMQRLNGAAEAALSAIAARSSRRVPAPAATVAHRRDHPSFTIEALPVEAFEALLVVAAAVGEVLDDDPPYALEVALSPGSWCRLDLVPDAGASTVSLAVGAEVGYRVPVIDAVRDAFVDGLNHLDWERLGADG